MSDLIIRDAKQSDAPAVREIYKPYVEESVITFEVEVPSVEEFEDRIKQCQESLAFLVCEKDGEVVGYAYGLPFSPRQAYRHTAEYSIYLKHGIHRNGMGQKLYQTLESRLYEAGIVTLLASIVSSNDKSVRFHLKNGFIERGTFPQAGYKFDEWLDIVWFSKQVNVPF